MSEGVRTSARYANVLACVDNIPRTTTDIYRRWNDLPEWKSLTRRHRNERKWLGKALENLAADGLIVREETTMEDHRCITFRKTE